MKTQTIAPKRWWYIMPIVFITYSLAYLDRANFSFASAAGINDDLGITKGMSSLLGALFFLGYFFFQIPGAVYAERRSVKKLIFWCLVPGAVGRLRFADRHSEQYPDAGGDPLRARRGGSGGYARHADLYQ